MSTVRQFTGFAVVLCLGMSVSLARPTAPVPRPDAKARRAFDTLKKKLLPVVARWLKEHERETGDLGSAEPEVKLARMIAPAQGKITLRLKETLDGKRVPAFDYFFSVYLSYYDDRWTTTGNSMHDSAYAIDSEKLMLAIDEIGEE